MTAQDNITRIKELIFRACSRINRNPEEITIVAVSKGRTVEQIQEAIEAGITDIGENRVQEAILKFSQLSKIKRHLVGHLQTNKAKDAVKIFDLIHSVDSLRLAEEIDKQAARINKVQDILIEVNTSGEESKFGIKPGELSGLAKSISESKNIRLLGLMTVAPIVDNPEMARLYFRQLKELLGRVNELRALSSELKVLSMGMTDDFQVAIEEGATMVRLGRAIFD
jgi:pyridoxal phosphate enzyme (YggS family)